VDHLAACHGDADAPGALHQLLELLTVIGWGIAPDEGAAEEPALVFAKVREALARQLLFLFAGVASDRGM
jgi:hypothetical protein